MAGKSLVLIVVALVIILILVYVGSNQSSNASPVAPANPAVPASPAVPANPAVPAVPANPVVPVVPIAPAPAPAPKPILPRVTNIPDCGYRQSVRGWFDWQGQGVPNDYCRYVGGGPSDAYFNCVLAGKNGAEATVNVNDALKKTRYPKLVSGDTCYTSGTPNVNMQYINRYGDLFPITDDTIANNRYPSPLV